MTEDELVHILDEWVDDAAPLNRAAFRPAARAILKRLAPDRDALAALAIEVKVEQAWLVGAPEWAHTELGRRFQLLLDHAKAVRGE